MKWKNKKTNQNLFCFYLIMHCMGSIKIMEEGCASVDFFSVYCTIIGLDNSYLVLFTDQPNYGLGTISLGSPSSIDGTKAEATPFSIFGYKHQILSKLITQMCSTKLRAPVLTLLYLKDDKIKQEVLSKLVIEAFNNAFDLLKSKNTQDLNGNSKKKETQLSEPKRLGFDQ